MKFLETALEIFLLYLLYKFIFDFIIPVYQSSKKIKKQFGEMQEKMQNDLRNYKNQQAPPRQETTSTKEGDYIDFEEVKK
ncbi:hypothetical protein EFY79_03495 [Hanamia caeni]|jgi:hypothetical protein|uniref:ATP synthase F0 subunit 8 n=1 Tax=Hanamia caeni TaxID=2294116 RepID=A0A3M9NLR8_9BACT|nr:hypothetical protein [Hanamia caeni]RNI38739.1 hypothetical protein EFY79_03495 [Hanamia caeni]